MKEFKDQLDEKEVLNVSLALPSLGPQFIHLFNMGPDMGLSQASSQLQFWRLAEKYRGGKVRASGKVRLYLNADFTSEGHSISRHWNYQGCL